jgi:hypothetical protein
MRILIGVLLLCAAAATCGQKLPIKEGLWEIVAYNDAGAPVFRAHYCLSQRAIVDMMTTVNASVSCKVTSQNFTSHSMTVDMACNARSLQMTSHGVIEILDSEHMRSTKTTKIVVRGHPDETSAKSSGHFLSSSCGNIKPNAPEILTK